MTGTLTFKFSINGKVHPDPVIIGVLKRTHEIARFVTTLCANMSKSPESNLPSYKNSPVHYIKKNKYFETGTLVQTSKDGEESSGNVQAVAGTEENIYRREGYTINTNKLRTKHEGYIASMVLDKDEFEQGVDQGFFRLNSRISFSKDAGDELDQKNVVFGFILGGNNVIDKILGQKLLQDASRSNIKIVSCSDPQFDTLENDM
jgi:cyclophilin family peptidyl-prolyl cis-trans isomerase